MQSDVVGCVQSALDESKFSYTNEKFVEMRDAMIKHFNEEMAQYPLFKLDIDTEELWNVYLESFPDFIKGPWRERAWHDCQACKTWFRKMGNVVAMPEPNYIITMFDCTVPDEYTGTFKALIDYIKEHNIIRDAFYSSDKKIGVLRNREQDPDTGKVITHDHFFTELPDNIVKRGIEVGRAMSKISTNKMVLMSFLDTVTIDAIDDVLDLIKDNNLYRGDEWVSNLVDLKMLKNEYDALEPWAVEKWAWYVAYTASQPVLRLKNTVMGALLLDIVSGTPLEDAVRKYESMVAPQNYKRPKAIFTQKMLDDAKNKIAELGYMNSLRRRYAVMEDLSVVNTLFANRDLTTGIKNNDLFDQLSEDTVSKPKSFDYEQTVSIDYFIDDILPKATEVFLYTQDAHASNFVSLIAPVDEEAPTMFKWGNPYSWAYKNNVADSMKEQVKSMGGDVDVDLRFSIRWNNGEEYDNNDLDAHCLTPKGDRIFFNRKQDISSRGFLDVDIIDPRPGKPAVENIQFKSKRSMPIGDYYFGVHQYSYRGGDNGFEAEIEFDNNIYHFDYPHKLKQDEFVDVACVTLDAYGKFTLTPKDKSMLKTHQKIWNVKMNDFIPVTLVCYSPNYWNDEVGNKQIFFMLKDCISDETPNAWFNEYLNNKLRANRRVMEALGAKAKVELTDNQLSGLGFSMTRHTTITVKVITDDVENIYNVKI